MAQRKLQFLLVVLLKVSCISHSLNLRSLQLSSKLAAGGSDPGFFKCTFDMFEAMEVCNSLDYKSCCTSVKTALYSGCLCSTVFQDYIRYCIEVTRELNDYLDGNCTPDQSKIDQVDCYRNLTYHEQHDPEVYSVCPLVSPSPSSMPDPDDRVSPWKWFWNTSGTLPPPPPSTANGRSGNEGPVNTRGNGDPQPESSTLSAAPPPASSSSKSPGIHFAASVLVGVFACWSL